MPLLPALVPRHVLLQTGLPRKPLTTQTALPGRCVTVVLLLHVRLQDLWFLKQFPTLGTLESVRGRGTC